MAGHMPDARDSHPSWGMARVNKVQSNGRNLFDSKQHYCEHCGPDHPIEIGDRYFDTGEVVGQWMTAKLCARHATCPRAEAEADHARLVEARHAATTSEGNQP